MNRITNANATSNYFFLFSSFSQTSSQDSREYRRKIRQYVSFQDTLSFSIVGYFLIVFSRWCCNVCISTFISSKHQLASKMAERKAVIKSADMSEDMQQDAVDCASQALEKYNIEKV
jgi:hypothetical protein